MALGASPDPIPASHQLMALLEYPELEGYERTSLEWLRDRLTAVRNQPSIAGWLAWYRDALGVIRQLTTRWQQPKDEPPSAPVPSTPLFNPAAVGRIKDLSNGFSQRWGVRLQDQAMQVKNQLLYDTNKLRIVQHATETHVVFRVDPSQIYQFQGYVFKTLSDWSSGVEASLGQSWYEHLRSAIHAEGLPSGATPPPPWPSTKLSPAALVVPQLDDYAIRRPTLANVFVRSLRSVFGAVSMFTTVVGLTLSTFGDPKYRSLVAAGTGALVLLMGGPLAYSSAQRSLRDELEQAERDQTQRLQGAVQSWLGQVIDGHRMRMQSLVGGAGGDVRSRLGEWADGVWSTKAVGPVVTPRGAPKGGDTSQWVSTLNLVKTAMATRAAQLEFEAGAPASAPRSVGK